MKGPGQACRQLPRLQGPEGRSAPTAGARVAAQRWGALCAGGKAGGTEVREARRASSVCSAPTRGWAGWRPPPRLGVSPGSRWPVLRAPRGQTPRHPASSCRPELRASGGFGGVSGGAQDTRTAESLLGTETLISPGGKRRGREGTPESGSPSEPAVRTTRFLVPGPRCSLPNVSPPLRRPAAPPPGVGA